MSHQRTAIRNALKSLLTGTFPAYATSAESRVYTNRTNNMQIDHLPSIEIKDGEESAVPRDTRSNIYFRTWSIEVECKVSANSGYDTSLDDLCKQIEDLVLNNQTISGTATGVVYSGTVPAFDGSGEKKIASASLKFEIKYFS